MAYWPAVWRRLRRDRAAVAGLALVAILALVALAAPWLAPYDPAEQFRDGLTPAGQPLPSTLPEGSLRFLLGTDAVGRDLFSRLLHGARVSLTVGVLANLLTVAIGTLLGATAGYWGGWVETLLMRVTDMMMAFPPLLLAMALVAILTPSMGIIIAVIGLVYWPWLARVIYGQVLILREREFVTAARALGTPRRRIQLAHILPHLLPTVLVWGTPGIATNVMLEASLSYLGIGVQPPVPSWGGMIQQGQAYYRTAPWLVVAAGVAILLTVLEFNLLGDGLRDALDPIQRGRD